MQRIIVINRKENLRHIGAFESSGAEVILLEPPEHIQADGQSDLLKHAAGIIFLDRVTAVAFIQGLGGMAGEVLDDKTVCAAGSAVVDALRTHSVHADVVVFDPSWETMCHELRNFTGDSDFRVLVVGGDASFRSKSVLSEDQGNFQVLFWPEGASAWIVDRAEAKMRALLLGGGVENIFIGGPDDIVAMEMTLGSLSKLREVSEFLTDDETSRRALAERGVVTRSAKT